MVIVPVCSVLIGFSLVSAIVIGFLDSSQKELARILALISSVISLAIVWDMWVHFDPSQSGFQLLENHRWISSLGMSYTLGVDGISLALIIVTVFTNFLIVISQKKLVKDHVPRYLALFFLMQTVVVGVFTALDAMLFYVFWESTLLPLYLCIGMYGSKDRNWAANKFFLYTFFGSSVFLLAIVYLGLKAESFNLLDFFSLSLTFNEQFWIFLACAFAFMVKVPMWPLHTWLPDAHVEAPCGGSVVLAAIMLKVGAFGFLRFNFPITPDASQFFAWPMIILSLFAIVYISFVAMAQMDMKRLIAYSSVAHMGIVTLGCFLIYRLPAEVVRNASILSMQGAVYQMIAHSFSSGALFLAFGLLYERTKERSIAQYGGLATTMPNFTWLFILFALSNVGLPATAGFVGEWMVISASMQASFLLAFAVSTTLVLSVCYTFWMLRNVFYGECESKLLQDLLDLDFTEGFVLGILAICILFFGVYPEALNSLVLQSSHDIVDLALRNETMY